MRHSAGHVSFCVVLLDLIAQTSLCWSWVHHASFCWTQVGMSDSVRYVYACVVLLDLVAQASFCWFWVHMRHFAGSDWACLILLDMFTHASFCRTLLALRVRLAWQENSCAVLLDMSVQWSMPDSAGHECVVPSLNYALSFKFMVQNRIR
jgi:hypothetical protein